jgi:hypothetical protein
MTQQAQISPTSNLPPAARAQVVAANKLIAELNAKPGQVPPGTEVQSMPNDQTPGANENNDRRWVPASSQMQPPQPAAQPTSFAPPPAQVPVVAEQPGEDWAQKYRSLQGKYNSEMASLREIMAAQQQTMDKLIERGGMPSVAPAPVVAKTPEETLKALGATDKEIEDYGELLPIVARLANNMVRPTLEKLEAELVRTKQAAGTVAQAQMKSSRELMFQTMDANPAIRGWRVINEDENFLAWLDGVDIFSGTSRRVSLTNAFQNLDTARVTAIFEKFIQEDSVRRSTSGPQVDPNTLIAPGVPRGGAAEAPGGANDRKIWTESEIRNFYTRVRKKQISQEDYARFSADIAAATQEGRIRPDRRDHHQNS